MRFKGFSSKVGKISMFALALALVTSLGVVSFPAEAEAGPGKRWVYTAKFKCIFTGDPITQVGTGTFLGIQTVVNIYNPTEDSISFRKHYVIAAPQFKQISSEKTSKESESVGAGLGHAINCRDIEDALDDVVEPSSYISDAFAPVIEGWVIIEAPKKGEASSKPVLSVCANYQHALFESDFIDRAGSGISVDIECFEPKKIKPKF